MFFQIFSPLPIRSDEAPYLWVAMKAIAGLNKDLTLISPEIYRKKFYEIVDIPPPESVDDPYEYLRSRNVGRTEFNNVPLINLPIDPFDKLIENHFGPGLAWRHCISRPVPDILDFLVNCQELSHSPEAILLWTNFFSVSSFAKSRSIPVIHNEIGPLRPPNYRPTAYFDLSGVNGKTEADRRWRTFVATDVDVPILSRSELLQLMAVKLPNYIEDTSSPKAYSAGVALQVPGDSNIIAFGKGFGNFEVIQTALHWFSGRPLIRAHPAQQEKIENVSADWDDSDTSFEFLHKIDSLITVNSSLAFESILLGKPTYIMGESPFQTASWDLLRKEPKLDSHDEVLWINWFVFCYLIPFEMLFCKDYYRWRLSMPSEREIYIRNFDYWKDTSN